MDPTPAMIMLLAQTLQVGVGSPAAARRDSVETENLAKMLMNVAQQPTPVTKAFLFAITQLAVLNVPARLGIQARQTRNVKT
jgi:hypothetical protein